MKFKKLAPILGAALLSTTVGASAFAQVSNPGQYSIDESYKVERFRLSTDRGGILDVEGAAVAKHLSFDLALYLNYSDDPLNVVGPYDTDSNGNAIEGRIASPIASRLAGSLVGSLALWDRIQLGIEVPLILTQKADNKNDLSFVNDNIDSWGIADVRLVPKINILNNEDHALDLGVAVNVSIPTGHDSDWRSEGELLIAPELLIGKPFNDNFRIGLNVGYLWRTGDVSEDIGNSNNNIDLEITDEIYGKLGAAFRVSDNIELNGTVSVSSTTNDFLSGDEGNINHLEVKGGANVMLGGAALFVAAGKGIANGWGTPDYRVLGGLRFGQQGSNDVEPQAVVEAGPLDTDGDGIMDDVDQCVNEPETINEIDDADGCPDAVGDADGDGMDDRTDQCPNEPEDVDTFKDDDGCPDVDNDADGIVDTKDQCPLEPGVPLNMGCPDKDTDGDTVPDRLDNCPNEAGDPAFSGCKEKQSVKIMDGKIELLDKVYFRTNKARIRAVSFSLLNNVAQVLNNHPEITSINVEGHTDSQGRDSANKRLSQRRADSVVKYLVKQGVDKSRLNGVGYGEETPIDTNDTKEGRAANRRVEFKIMGGGDGIGNANSGPTGDTIGK